MTADGPESGETSPPTDASTAANVPKASSRVFVSYASQDAIVATALVENLERHGVACWIAPRDVKAGALYADAIVRAISDTKALVLVLSANSVASTHVGKEVERASSKRRPLIALRIDDAPLSPALEYFLGESHWVDARAGAMDAALAKLIAAIREPERNAAGINPAVAAVTSAGTAAAPPKSRRIRILLAAGITGVAVALVALLADKFWLAKHVAVQPPMAAVTNITSDRSIAVLPFTDMSEKKDQEYFADGMAEEVIDLLARLPGIRVIGRTSSFQFKAKTEDLRVIGRALGAAYVVEGSVRKSGDRIRVTAQLIGAQDGSHVWSESYDEPSDDVLKVQDKIATGLVRALQVTVGADESGPTPTLKSSEAYDLYLRGRHAIDQWDQAGFEAAEEYLHQALELDPTAARTAEWLATAQLYRAIWGFVPVHEGFERARLSAQLALKLNPRSGTAHAVLASINTDYDWDWPAADRECEQALALEPRNPTVVGDAGFARSAFAQPEESARLIGAALTLDPLNGTWHEVLGQMRYRAGRLAEAEAELHKALEISPTYAEAHFFLGQILLAKGEPDAALAAMQQEVPESGRDTGLAIAYQALGRRAESDRALALQTTEHASDAAYEIAQAHAYRAELDQAFAWLDRAFIQKDVELYWIKGDPLLKHLEGDARYKAFLRKMNLPD
jgi:TolB-like protein